MSTHMGVPDGLWFVGALALLLAVPVTLPPVPGMTFAHPNLGVVTGVDGRGDP